VDNANNNWERDPLLQKDQCTGGTCSELYGMHEHHFIRSNNHVSLVILNLYCVILFYIHVVIVSLSYYMFNLVILNRSVHLNFRMK
jgi:hypothetical protein